MRYSSADGRVVLAELAADRLHLLAQDVLALLLGGAGLDVLADALADLQLGQALALELQRQLEALGDVERLEQRDLLLEGQVGRVAGGVGQRAGLGDRAHPGGDAAVVAAQLEDLLDRGAVLALELARAAVDGHVVGVLGDLDAQAPGAVGVRGAGDAAAHARQHRRRGRRRAGGRAAPRGRSCRPWRTRPRGAGRAGRAPRSPVSTGSVTSMVGKTTVSSSGMRSSVCGIDNLCQVQLSQTRG